MKITIVSGGTAPTKQVLSRELNDSDYLICADSGANSIYNYNIYPDFLIGDFDSIDIKILNYFKESKTNIIQYPRDKDYTDTEIAIDKAIELGAKEIVLLGCTGSRLDHTLGNISMLFKCLKVGIKATIIDSNNRMFMADKSIAINGDKGEKFSVFPFGGSVYNLSIIGAKYTLEEFDLELGTALTLSNEFLEEEVVISFERGILLVIFPVDWFFYYWKGMNIHVFF